MRMLKDRLLALLAAFGLWASLAASAAAAPLKIALGPWHTSGPLPVKSFGEVCFPEQGVDLAAKNAAGQPLWQARAEWTDGQAHDLPGSATVSTYLFRTIHSDKPVRVTAGLGSDDGLEVWLNGERLLARDVARGLSPNADEVPLDLRPGENRLLLKIHNRGGGHGFFFGLDTSRTSAAQRAGIAKHAPALLQLASTRAAVEDLIENHGGRYARGREFLGQLADIEKRLDDLEAALVRGDQNAVQQLAALGERFAAVQREALLANPRLDFDRLLLVRRSNRQLGLPQNWQGNCAVPRNGYDNEIAVLSPVGPQGKLTTLYRPDKGEFVGDVDLHFDADKMLFSMPGGKHNRWQIWELRLDGKADGKGDSPVLAGAKTGTVPETKTGTVPGLRQVTPGEENDVDNYDACYLPDGRIVFDSTRCFHGVPCVGGGNTVANLCLMNADGSGTRQLCYDQDHDWCPTVLNNGRVLYSRWEYSDSPHYFTRLLFQMNPDGTGQMEYYGSNSMWPNSIFYARPIPGHPTAVVAVISGHHGVPRMGELVVFDPAKGRREADGAVQRIPAADKRVNPVIRDTLVDSSWPKFLHPYPLSDKHFLVSCKPTERSEWGIYLVDTFDNMVLIKEEPGFVLFEPLPLRKTPRPPVVPDRVNTKSREATVYLSDIYAGEGLKNVPRGTVKRLRIYEPHYAYPGMGGHIDIGIDGPWDARRIHGTVPVEADGSASFKAPANTPLAVQPLDADGKALQVMRSWFTAMPGETLSCVGCHESQNSTPPPKRSMATLRAPSRIEPWYGPVRGFSFKREVQPVLDKYCVGCHDGKQQSGGPATIDLTARDTGGWRNFTPSYVALHPFVRRPGPESDYHLQKPLEFHADTSELMQMLNRGHYNVKLDAEAADRLATWIDLNVPDHGTWHEQRRGHSSQEKRRLEMRTLYGNRPEDPEAIPEIKREPVAFVQPAPLPERKAPNLTAAGWPFDAAEAIKRQAAAGLPPKIQIDLRGDGTGPGTVPVSVSANTGPSRSPDTVIDLVLIPAGEYLIGDAAGEVDEYPPAKVRIDKPFYMATTEVTNAQYAAFDPQHNSEVISMTNKDQNERGYPVNQPQQPVVRVTWNEAMAFCKWLSEKTQKKVSLPTEAQWEWACRAGTATPFSYGGLDTDFSKLANLADSSLDHLARGDSPKWHPKDSRFNDGAMVTAHVRRYQPNAWGLFDMHGNAAEWTRTAYRPYPYDDGDGRNDPQAAGLKTVRGGSWYDRPIHARSSARLPYRPWQAVYNVGFRVMMAVEE